MLHNSTLLAVLTGLQAKRAQVNEQVAQLAALLGGPVAVEAGTRKGQRGGRRVFSAESRRRMAEAQRKRWAKSRGEE